MPKITVRSIENLARIAVASVGHPPGEGAPRVIRIGLPGRQGPTGDVNPQMPILAAAAEASAAAAGASETAALAAQDAAETARTQAQSAQSAAESARDTASGHATAAGTARTAAESARDTAQGAATTATTKAGEAAASAAAALVSETAAEAARDDAATYAGIDYIKQTWTALAAVTGSVGEYGYVLDEDTGTHTDPVTASAVANAGRYAWSASPAGWERIAGTGLTEATARAERNVLATYIYPLQQALIAQGWNTAGNLPTPYYPPLLGSDGEAALFDLFTDHLYYAGGTVYDSKAALLGALGGAEASAAVNFGPWVSSTRTPAVPNQTFDADVSGWDTYGTASVSWSSANGGQLVLTGDGGNRRAARHQILPADGSLKSKCFRITGTGARGTSGNSFQFVGTVQNSTFGASVGSGLITSTTLTTPAPCFLNTGPGTGAWVGFMNTGATGTGTGLMTEIDVREARPWEAFPQGAFDLFVQFETPASIATDQVLWQADAATERDRIRLVMQASDNHLLLVVTQNNSAIASLDLGAVALSESHKVAIGIGDSYFAASLNGSTPLIDASGSAPGVAYMRVGRSFTGEDWLGTVTRVAMCASSMDPTWLQYVTGGGIAEPGLWTEGDSYMAGSGGVVLNQKLATATSIPAVNTAVGGSTFGTIRDRVLNAPLYLLPYTLVIWDGSANGFVSVSDTLAMLDQMVTRIGHSRWLFIPPVVSANTGTSPTEPSAYNLSMKEIRDTAISTYGPQHVLDPWPILQALAADATDDADVAGGSLPRSIYLDGVHLNSAAMDAIATAAAVKIAVLVA